MDTIAEEFANELGNTIRLESKREDIGGVPGIAVAISGPTSYTTIYITLMEAQKLHEQLTTMLTENKTSDQI